MFRFAAVISFLLTAVLATGLVAVVSKAAFVVFVLPFYLLGSGSLLVLALVNHLTLKAPFKPAFLIAAVFATLVMVASVAQLNGSNFWMIIQEAWLVYGIFLGVHAAIYFWFLDESRYRRFRAVFFAS